MRRGLHFLSAAVSCIVAGGIGLSITEHMSGWRGLYCALGAASTAGCDVTAATSAARIVSAALLLTAVPLLAAAFSSLTAAHVHKRLNGSLTAGLDGLRQKIADDAAGLHLALQSRLERHQQDLLERMDVHAVAVKNHVTRVADGPVRGGAGSNPAEGLPAETAGAAPAGPVVPPPATPARKTRSNPRTRNPPEDKPA